MFSKKTAIVCAAVAAFGISASFAGATVTYSTNFDSMSLGSINGQEGWQVTNPSFDQEVISGAAHSGTQMYNSTNTYTTGSFGDQPFSAPLPGGNAAGESTVSGVTGNTATYSVWFKAGTTSQDNSAISISLSDVGGSRINYVSLDNSNAGGVLLTVYDTTSNGFGNTADFNPSSLGNVDRTSWHQLLVTSVFNDGPNNEVVQYYVDGSLKATIGSWEDYYRDDPEQAGNGNQLFAVDRVLFREGGTAQSGVAGFNFDDFSLTNATVPEPSYLGVAGLAASALLMRRRRGRNLFGH